jgi:hypothetical protein
VIGQAPSLHSFPVIGKPSEKRDTNLKHLSELTVIEESVWGFKYEGRRKVYLSMAGQNIKYIQEQNISELNEERKSVLLVI